MTIVRALAAATILGATGAAMAVGDLPMKLTGHHAAAEYAGVRGLLTDRGGACPAGQVAVSGLVTGGSTPTTGSQTVTIAFDGGAVVKIVKSWNGPPGKPPATSVTVSCDPAPARRGVDLGQLIGDGKALPATCAMIEQSLRVPPSGKCPRPSPEPSESPGPARGRGKIPGG